MVEDYRAIAIECTDRIGFEGTAIERESNWEGDDDFVTDQNSGDSKSMACEFLVFGGHGTGPSRASSVGTVENVESVRINNLEVNRGQVEPMKTHLGFSDYALCEVREDEDGERNITCDIHPEEQY